MKRPTTTILLCTLLATALTPVGTQAAEDRQPGYAPLDLSLPKDALRKDWGGPPIEDAKQLPDLGGTTSGSGGRGGANGSGRGGGANRGRVGRSDLPYGAGYEARHGGGGAGGGMGAGRGGRGR